MKAEQTVRCEDTVVDSLDEGLWRLRALAGLRATVGSRILAIGGPASQRWLSLSGRSVGWRFLRCLSRHLGCGFSRCFSGGFGRYFSSRRFGAELLAETGEGFPFGLLLEGIFWGLATATHPAHSAAGAAHSATTH
ncbi:MAG: hypothetical protein KJZ87_10140, partial [Thermoguttaceae bacterium]|nr:hypothetical protein [Thermoguttaceae bacterium]